jgi:hypothetical protein
VSELWEKERTAQHSAKPPPPATPKAAQPRWRLPQRSANSTNATGRRPVLLCCSAGESALAVCVGRHQVRAVPAPLRFTFWIAALAALASAVAYALTFADRTYYAVLALLPLLLLVWLGVVTQWRRVPRRNLVSEIFGDIPRWMKAAVVGLLVFVFANFFVCRALNEHARPDSLPDGRTVLVDRGGKIVRTLGDAEYRHAQAVQLRMLSGSLVACFGLAALLAEACWIKNGTAMADRRV